jgi:hypothetical protein
MEQKQELTIGGVVVFIDQHRLEHKALVTCIHGDPQGRQMREHRKSAKELTDEEKASGKWRVDQWDPPIYAYEVDENGNDLVDYGEPGEDWPCINLVIVSPNTDCQDPYGRQLERHTSVVHQSHSSAVGYCFRFEDERLKTELRQPTVS